MYIATRCPVSNVNVRSQICTLMTVLTVEKCPMNRCLPAILYPMTINVQTMCHSWFICTQLIGCDFNRSVAPSTKWINYWGEIYGNKINVTMWIQHSCLLVHIYKCNISISLLPYFMCCQHESNLMIFPPVNNAHSLWFFNFSCWYTVSMF